VYNYLRSRLGRDRAWPRHDVTRSEAAATLRTAIGIEA